MGNLPDILSKPHRAVSALASAGSTASPSSTFSRHITSCILSLITDSNAQKPWIGHCTKSSCQGASRPNRSNLTT